MKRGTSPPELPTAAPRWVSPALVRIMARHPGTELNPYTPLVPVTREASAAGADQAGHHPKNECGFPGRDSVTDVG
jgi:hypothetical protein